MSRWNFCLDDRRQPGLELDGPGRLGIVAAGPGRAPLAVGQTRDAVLVPVLVDRGEIGVVVVDAVAEAQGVELAGVVGLRLRRPLCPARPGCGSVKLSPPSRQPVSWSVMTHLGHAVAGDLLPEIVVVLAVGGPVGDPQPLARHVHPGRLGIGHVGQHLLEPRRNRQEQPLEAVVAAAVGLGQVARAAVVDDPVLLNRVGGPQRRGVRQVIVQKRRDEQRLLRPGRTPPPPAACRSRR